MTTFPPPGYMSRKEVADAFGVVPVTVTRWRKRGRITAVTVPGIRRLLYERAYIEALLRGEDGTS